MREDSPLPGVVPLSDGGLQIEWHGKGRHLEIEFPADEAPKFYYYEDDTGEEIEDWALRNYERVQELLSRIK